MVLEETQKILYSSDLFIQPGDEKPTTGQDLSEQMADFYRLMGAMPSMKHIHAALDKMDSLPIETIACHHGSVLTGDLSPYFKILRDEDVTTIAEYGTRSAPNLMRE